jgi:hypothetical protein
MKKIITIALVGMLFSCTQNNNIAKPKERFSLEVYNFHYAGTNSQSGSTILCDSFQMIDTKKCYFWVNGAKNTIVCDVKICPYSNY